MCDTMASSSVSQESLDRDDYEYTARKNRARVFRVRGPAPYRAEPQESDDVDVKEHNGNGCEELDVPHSLHTGVEHESPTRLATRGKDKRARPNHLHKGKTVKDKRKLREKRRSTGVVHLPSTESTGDSLDDDDDGSPFSDAVRKNTAFNESAESRIIAEETSCSSRRHRNKSPSDLEADLEDNQDYDSTVSQSETSLSVMGPSSPRTLAGLHKRSHLAESPSHSPTLREEDGRSSRPITHAARFREHEWERRRGYSPESHRGVVRSGHESGHISRIHREAVSEKDATAAIEMTKLLTQTKDLEKMLEDERSEKEQLRRQLEQRDARIAQLEKEVTLLHQELEDADEELRKRHQENQVLLRAMSALSTHV